MSDMLRFCAVIMAAVLLLSACSGQSESNVINIDPEEQALNYEDSNAVLYFVNSDYTMLVGVEREIGIPVSSNIEYGVVEALIRGHQNSSDEIRSIINPSTRILAVTKSRNTITVVLSKEFLDWSFISDTFLNSASYDHIKQLSVYSIVNSLVETALCKNVQILVDRNDNGSGQRVRLSEVGMSGDGVLGQLTRRSDLILTSETTLEEIFICLSNRDYVSLYNSVASKGDSGEEKPVLNNFVSLLQAMDVSVEDFRIVEKTDHRSQNQTTILCDYVTVDAEGDRIENRDIPVRLKKENGLWKISYEMLQKLLA